MHVSRRSPKHAPLYAQAPNVGCRLASRATRKGITRRVSRIRDWLLIIIECRARATAEMNPPRGRAWMSSAFYARGECTCARRDIFRVPVIILMSKKKKLIVGGGAIILWRYFDRLCASLLLMWAPDRTRTVSTWAMEKSTGLGYLATLFWWRMSKYWVFKNIYGRFQDKHTWPFLRIQKVLWRYATLNEFVLKRRFRKRWAL